jgi:cellulose synthase/poly-beta-1,6-N-acetylglucosamine synthase-like glycosyltransferase
MYSLGLALLIVQGGRVFVLTLVYWAVRGHKDEPAACIGPQPTVTIQLPLYNEPSVARRAIDSACRLRWPADRLEVQVLDDSTDGTSALVDRRARAWRRRGIDIQVVRRAARQGYKAGALAHGLDSARGELVAVFDADFVPDEDFLERTTQLMAPDVAVVQARWGHLNRELSGLTRAQALALDGYFLVDQTARSRAGLFPVFNGSAGVWRRAAIDDAGGWQGDTLSEDVDLSYRAQLAGWRVVFAPDIVVPAELPTTLAAFKVQQRRWACGTTQAMCKLGPRVASSPRSLWVRTHALLGLASHLAHPLSLGLFLLAPAVMVLRPGLHTVVGLVALAAVSPPLMYAVAAAELYRDWVRRLAVYPLLAALGAGLTLTGTLAVVDALLGRPTPFERTPKAGAARRNGHPVRRAAAPSSGIIVTCEALLAAYGWLGLLAAVYRGSLGFALLFALFAVGYTFTASLTWQGIAGVEQRRSAPSPRAGEQ